MFEDYIPKKFCREFVAVKGHSWQLAMIMAVVTGIKPCMDDWVSLDRYDPYRKICSRYGLYVRADAVFNVVRRSNILQDVIGGDHLTTTIAYGRPFDRSVKEGAVHVFIARKKHDLDNCFANGWYPLVVNGRVIDRPVIDALEFGHDLGYPVCCVGFFQKYYDWNRYSYLYEAYKNTPHGDYRYLCNPFTKDITYSYIYHMPCAFNCLSTAKLAGRLRNMIYQQEPDFAKKIDERLRLPVLVFYEKKFYAFSGRIKNNRLYYQDVFFLGGTQENNLYETILKRGDCLFVEDKDVMVLRRGKLIKRIKWHKKSFAPETPFIIQFN